MNNIYNLQYLFFCVSFLSFSLLWGGERKTPSQELFKGEERQFGLMVLEENERKNNLLRLQEAKTLMVNGNIDKAGRILKQMNNLAPAVFAIRQRYLAIYYFINNQFPKAFQILNDPKMITDNDFYSRICTLRIYLQIILNFDETIGEDLSRCSDINLGNANFDYQWLEMLVNLKQKKKNITKTESIGIWNSTHINDKNYLHKITRWLKTSIYLNKEKEVVKLLPELDQSVFQSDKVREMIALIYYRLGKSKESLNLIEDIYSANAENIKGNIKLEEKKYELAFNHFQLALKKKQNSLNAIERSISLAWPLGQHQIGLKLVQKIKEHGGNIKNKIPLLMAFHTAQGEIEKSYRFLPLIQKLFPKELPKEINHLLAYNALWLGYKEEAQLRTEKSCQQYSGLNCWVLLQSFLWDNLSKTLQRKDETNDDSEITLEELKKKIEISSLEEEVFINQEDIEELDDLDYKLNF